MNENNTEAPTVEINEDKIVELPKLESKPKDEKSMRKLFTHEKKLFQLCKNKRGGSFNRRRSILRTVCLLREKLGLKSVELKDYI